MTMQALALRRENGAVQHYEVPAEEEEGALGLAPEDVRPPFVRFNGQTGEILFTHDGTVNESLDVVVLRKLPDTRVYFNPDLDAPDKVLCRSADNIVPVDAEQAAAIGAGPACASCPFAQFGKDEKGKTTKAPCSQVLNVAVAVVPAGEDDVPIPALMALRSTAIKPMRAVLSQLEIQHRATRRPAYSWIVQLAAGERQKDGAKAWYPLAAKVLSERVPDGQLPAYAALWRLMREVTVDVTTEAEMAVAPDAGAVREPGDGTAERPYSGDELDAELERRAADEAPPADASNAAWESLQASAPPHGDPVDTRRGRRL